MMFKVIWSKKADTQIRKLDKKARKRIYEKVDSIRNNPYIFVKPLFGINLYSLRIGNYRVLMTIKQNIMAIFILKVGHRKKVYEKLR